jgi:hypothetical protein
MSITGIGFKGKHSKKDFLDIMNTYYKEQCSDYLMRKKYKPCVEASKINSDFIKIYKKNNSFFRDRYQNRKYKKSYKKCKKYRETHKLKCRFNDYMEFSGAKVI